MSNNTARKIIDIREISYIDDENYTAVKKQQQKKKAEAAKKAAMGRKQKLLTLISIPTMLICLAGLFSSLLLIMGIFPSLGKPALYTISVVLTVIWLRWFIAILHSAKEWVFAKRK